MTLKVTKKGTKFAVVKEIDKWGDATWWLVDVEKGVKLDYYWHAADAKYYMDSLENGYLTTDYFSSHFSYGEPIDMPDSLKKLQQQILYPKPTKKPASKPIGSTSASIEKVIDKGSYKILKMDDGTFGTLVMSTGESKFGLKSANGASKSGSIMAKKAAGAKLAEIGVDPGSDAVDTLLHVYEDRMRDMYGRAAKEMAEKQAEFLKKFDKDKAAMLEAVRAGNVSDENYRKWLKEQGEAASWHREMVDSLSQDLVSVDKKAMDMLNGYIPRAYAENMNYATFQIENDASVNTGFSLYNESTVARLIANPEGSLLPDLPQAKIDELKDQLWSKGKISSSVAQSILQGESVPEAAKRLSQVVGMSANSAMRAARTALTAAQNLGRLDAGRRAKEMGIELKKQWVATADSRTRYSHREVDRETVELEEDFSNGCDCPGHLNGGTDGSEVYNCRCAMRYVLPGHEYDDLPDKTKEGVDYDEWKNEHQTKLRSQQDKIQAEYDEAVAKLAELKAKLPPDKDFNNIVQGGAKASQWTPEKVADSEDFYFKKLQKAIAENNQYDIDWYKKRLAQLKEFDDAGRAYHEAHKLLDSQLQRWQSQADKAKEKLAKMFKKQGGFANAFSEERRSKAHYWGDKAEADRVMRPLASKAWLASPRDERRAANRYTDNYFSRYNRPLNGFDHSYGNYVGYGLVDLDAEGEGSNIRRLTRIVERSVTEEDMWLRRGTDRYEMDTFFGFPAQNRFASLTDEELRGLIGTSARVGSFLSTGTAPATGAGFGGEVNLEIFVPAGSQALYCEPFSAFGGSGAGTGWDGKSGQSYFGREFETLLQRGGSYTCIDIERRGSGWNVKLELHPEDGYDTFQQ